MACRTTAGGPLLPKGSFLKRRLLAADFVTDSQPYWGVVPIAPHTGIAMSAKSTLSPQFIAAQRERLEALKAELLDADNAAQKEVGESQRDGGAEAQEYEDAAQDMDRKEVLQAKHDVDQRRLSNIDRALRKIELGTYGLSDKSGKAIPKERLEASPEAVLTVEEAAAKE
jgi:DnaK suppressor protein